MTTERYVFICDECLGLCVSVFEGELRGVRLDQTQVSELSAEHIADVLARVRAKAAASGPPKPDEFHCSFCRKPRDRVARLVSGPRVFICDVCLEDAVRCVNAAISSQSGT